MKTHGAPVTFDEYNAGFPAGVQRILEEIRRIVHSAAPDAAEAIKYRIPTFVLGGNLIHFAAFNRHIGFYPTPSGLEAFKDELSGYHCAKGSIQFPLDRPVPFSLIRRIVEFRVTEARLRMTAGRKPMNAK